MPAASFVGKVSCQVYGAWYCGCWWFAVAYNAGLSGVGNFVNGRPTESLLFDPDDKNNAAAILPRQAVTPRNEDKPLVVSRGYSVQRERY